MSDIGQDPFDLQRFVAAQDSVYGSVLAELGAGRKTGHWIWYVFPQIRGLGMSATSQRYAISTLDEAAAYLAHPVLGPRLVECVELVLAVKNRTAEQIFGHPDCLKFRSCATLFAQVKGASPVFQQVLDRYYSGDPDPLTLGALEGAGVSSI